MTCFDHFSLIKNMVFFHTGRGGGGVKPIYFNTYIQLIKGLSKGTGDPCKFIYIDTVTI